MIIGHDALVSLVATVNGSLALVSWPFALYEVFSKNPGIPELSEQLELRRNQILVSIALDLAARLRPFWPKTARRIIVDPYEEDEPPNLSEDAIDELKACLESHEDALHNAIKLRGMSSKVLWLNSFCYWSIFATGLESLGGLVLWLFIGVMSEQMAIALIALPVLTALCALICAGVRQGFIHSAHYMIVSIEDQ